MFVLVLVQKTTAQRVPLGDAGGSPIAERHPPIHQAAGAAGLVHPAGDRHAERGPVRDPVLVTLRESIANVSNSTVAACEVYRAPAAGRLVRSGGRGEGHGLPGAGEVSEGRGCFLSGIEVVGVVQRVPKVQMLIAVKYGGDLTADGLAGVGGTDL